MPLDELRSLASHGQFEALGHGCWDASHDCDQCDNCYSGDTEFEMRSGPMIFGDIWMKTAKDMGLPTNRSPIEESDAEEDQEDDSEEESCGESCTQCNEHKKGLRITEQIPYPICGSCKAGLKKKAREAVVAKLNQ